MKREEFLISFKEALTGIVPESVIQENMIYYQNYIESQMREGRIENDILQELGNPRLLAKTIIESNKFAMREEETQGSFYSSDDGAQYGRENTSQYEKKGKIHRMHTWNMPGWLAGILGILFTALVICLLFSVISFFAPIIVVAVMSILVYKIIRWLSVRY